MIEVILHGKKMEERLFLKSYRIQFILCENQKDGEKSDESF